MINDFRSSVGILSIEKEEINEKNCAYRFRCEWKGTKVQVLFVCLPVKRIFPLNRYLDRITRSIFYQMLGNKILASVVVGERNYYNIFFIFFLFLNRYKNCMGISMIRNSSKFEWKKKDDLNVEIMTRSPSLESFFYNFMTATMLSVSTSRKHSYSINNS